MTRVIAIVAVALIIIGLLAWLADEVGGAGFWYNVGDVLLGIPIILFYRVLWWAIPAYLICVAITGRWVLWW